jgi:uncharacterized protein (TIGR03083 family)
MTTPSSPGPRPGAWDITSYKIKDKLLAALWTEAEALVAIAGQPAHWQAPTACAGWELRDVVGHLIDTTEGYAGAFDEARGKRPAGMPLGLADMSRINDERARAFRTVSGQDELVARLETSLAATLRLFEQLTADEWAGLSVPHSFAGRIPAWAYPTLQLLECAVHRWDIQSVRGRGCVLSGEAADPLVPFMFFLCQITARVPGDIAPFRLGLVVSGPATRTYRMAVQPGGLTFEPGPVDDLPAVIEFDPASFILTMLGRTRSGTVRGSQEMAETFLGLFVRV